MLNESGRFLGSALPIVEVATHMLFCTIRLLFKQLSSQCIHLVPLTMSSVTTSITAIMGIFLYITIIDCNVKRFAPTYNKHFLSHLFTRCKRDINYWPQPSLSPSEVDMNLHLLNMQGTIKPSLECFHK